MAKKVLCIPDQHSPWTDIEKLNLIYQIAIKLKPDCIVNLGDSYDMYAHSKFARGHDLCTPQQEILEARQLLENMWFNLHKLCPKASLYAIRGNHDVRAEKRIYEKYPEIASLVDLSHLWKFKNVETLLNDKDHLEIDGIIYLHGWMTKLGDHCRYFNKSVVHGHTHRGGVYFEKRGFGELIFELDCGHIADISKVPLQYGATKSMKHIPGCGFIDELGPRFIPL